MVGFQGNHYGCVKDLSPVWIQVEDIYKRTRHLTTERAVHSPLRVSASSPRPVDEQFNDVIADQHVLSPGKKLSVSPAGVVCHAVLPIGPVGDQNHHPAAFLDQNRMADESLNTGDMFFHVSNDLLQQIIADNFTNEHFCGSHLMSFH